MRGSTILGATVHLQSLSCFETPFLHGTVVLLSEKENSNIIGFLQFVCMNTKIKVSLMKLEIEHQIVNKGKFTGTENNVGNLRRSGQNEVKVPVTNRYF